jgi:hypothetical protein
VVLVRFEAGGAAIPHCSGDHVWSARVSPDESEVELSCRCGKVLRYRLALDSGSDPQGENAGGG